VHGRKIPLANSQTTNHHTKNDHKTIETNTKKQSSIRNQQQNKDSKPLFCSRPLSSSQATTHRHAIAPAHGRPAGTTGIESRQAKAWGGDPGAQKRIRTTPTEHPTTDEPKAHDIFHTSNPSTRDHRAGGFAPDAERRPVFSVERR